VSKLARVMAQEEGDNVLGSVPNRDHNPLDLRHSPHSSHAGEGPNDIGIIDNDADGWADAEEQLQRYAARGMTLAQMVYTLAPPSENDSQQYLDFVCAGMGMPPTTSVATALKIA
jgi:hypothetical protein